MTTKAKINRNNITVWAENSRSTRFPILETTDHSPNSTTLRIGVRYLIRIRQNRFHIFRVGWSRNGHLKGNYYCTLQAESSAIERTRHSPTGSHTAPKVCVWMMEQDGMSTYGSFNSKWAGWPMMGPGYIPPHATSGSTGARNVNVLAKVKFDVWRIQNPEALFSGIKLTGETPPSIEQLRASNINIELSADPVMTFEFIFELTVGPAAAIGPKRLGAVALAEDDDSESDAEETSSDGGTGSGAMPSDITNQRRSWMKIIDNDDDDVEGRSYNYKHNNNSSRFGVKSTLSKKTSSSLSSLSTLRSIARGLRAGERTTAVTAQASGSGSSMTTVNHESSTPNLEGEGPMMTDLKNMMERRRALNEKVRMLVEKKKAQNEKLRELLLKYA